MIDTTSKNVPAEQKLKGQDELDDIISTWININNGKRPNINDVARLSGVSKKTV